MSLSPNILISGGGTGGHIFPALAIARELQRRHPDAHFLFVGALGRMEMERVPAAGFPIEGLPVAGFDRRRPWRNVGVLLKLLRSIRMARQILRRFRPDIAIGVGGYASGPMLKAAQRHGIPTVLQEQNSYAGVTNKLLARRAQAICVAYPDMERFFPAEKITLTGNPLRPEVQHATLSRDEGCRRMQMDPARPVILILGGSLGARTVNEAVAAAADAWMAEGAQILWQTGRLYYDQYRMRQCPGLHIMPFIDDMQGAYAAADIVVSRAGAGTISELQALGKCVVLVPSPNVAEDHQRRNAEALSTRDAAVMVLDADAPTQLGPTVSNLLSDPARRDALARACRDMALGDAAGAIADIIDNILSRK